jgi:hypothetical protein
MDERTKNLFFLAGEENIIEIYPNGRAISFSDKPASE